MDTKVKARFSKRQKGCFWALTVYIFIGFCVCIAVGRGETQKKVSELSQVHLLTNAKEVWIFIDIAHSLKNTAMFADPFTYLDKRDLHSYKIDKQGFRAFPKQEFDVEIGQEADFFVLQNKFRLFGQDSQEFVWSENKFIHESTPKQTLATSDPRIKELRAFASESRSREIVVELAKESGWHYERFDRWDFMNRSSRRKFFWKGKRYYFELTETETENRIRLFSGEKSFLDIDINLR